VQGKHEVGTVLDGVLDESTEALDRRVIAIGGPVGCFQYELEGPVRQRREQGIAGGVTPVERADTYTGVRSDGGEWYSGTFPPHRHRRGREHAITVGRRVATQFTRLGALVVSPLGLDHTPDDGSS
jgi:hypothetical protein